MGIDSWPEGDLYNLGDGCAYIILDVNVGLTTNHDVFCWIVCFKHLEGNDGLR
jgi:hypothetical protein